jgi:hypothetical protein
VKIGICEKERSLMGDDLLVSRMTSKDGAFKVDWKTKQHDWWDDSLEIYAKFDGIEKYTHQKPVFSKSE